MSGALSHWKMQTKQDVLIGKVISGRPIVESRAGPLIQRGFTSVPSASYLMGLFVWLCSFLERLVIERRRFRKER